MPPIQEQRIPAPKAATPVNSLVTWGGIVLLSLFFSALLTFSLEEKLCQDRPAMVLRGAGPPDSARQRQQARKDGKAPVFQKIRDTGGVITAEYGFINFNDDPLNVSFSITTRELAAYKADYGYTKPERDAVDEWQKKTLDQAFQHAVTTRQSQEQLNRTADKIAAEYKTRLKSFYHERGFSVLEGNLLMVNIPEIVKRNSRKLRGIALAINNQGEKLGYDSDSVIIAALSLVQTAVRYENVPMEVVGRQIGGLFPPLECMAKGKGDCDTKTALLAAILLNWDKIKVVGVGVPGHYLMGILRNPAKGDAFVEYRGMRYVLVEPAGPGWLPPGTIDRNTTALLNASGNVKIEPFSAR